MKKLVLALMGLMAVGGAVANGLLVAVAVSVGVHLAAFFGFGIDYFKNDVKETASSTTPIKVVLVNTPAAESRRAEIEANEGTAPPSSSSYAIQTGTSWSKTFTASDGTTVSITGTSAEELLQKMFNAGANKTGSPVVSPAVYSFNRSTALNGANWNPQITYIKNTTTKASIIRFTQYVSCGYQCSSAQIVEFTANQEYTCPPGYVETAGTASTTCTLSDPVAARASGTLKNNLCIIGRNNTFNQFDPDCAALQQQGKLKKETDATGNPAAVINNQVDNEKMARVCEYADGTPVKCVISRTRPNQDGSYRREDTVVDPETGKPGPTDSEQPAGPGQQPSEYPGQKGTGGTCDPNSGPIPAWCYGTGNGGGTIIGGGGSSLTPEQIGQGVKEGLKTDEELSIGGDDQLEGHETENNSDGIFGKILDLKRFEVRAPNQNCMASLDTGAGTNLTFDMLGGRSMPVSFNLNGACQLIEPHEGLIKQTCEILWFIFAVFLFIRSTT